MRDPTSSPWWSLAASKFLPVPPLHDLSTLLPEPAFDSSPASRSLSLVSALHRQKLNPLTGPSVPVAVSSIRRTTAPAGREMRASPTLRSFSIAVLGITTILSVLINLTAWAAEKRPTPDPNRYKHEYNFGADWFWPSIPNWERNLAHMKGKPNLAYLEVGPFEGRSFFWLLDNIFMHATTRATAIDIFETGTSTWYIGEFEARFRKNAKISGREKDITIIKGYSQVELRSLPLESFDLIYIDGSHATNDVLADIVLSWGLLKNGGIIILDDYRWHADWPFDLRPAFAIRAFIAAYNKEIEALPQEPMTDQVMLRKRPNRCLKVHYEGCSYLGKKYLYDWRGDGQLIHAETLMKIPLTPKEKRVVERILRTRYFGNIDFEIDEELRTVPAFQALNERLDLGL